MCTSLCISWEEFWHLRGYGVDAILNVGAEYRWVLSTYKKASTSSVISHELQLCHDLVRGHLFVYNTVIKATIRLV